MRKRKNINKLSAMLIAAAMLVGSISSSLLVFASEDSAPSSKGFNLSVTGNGNAIVKLEKDSDETLKNVENGSANFGYEVGDRVFIKTYAVDENETAFKNEKGLKEISKKDFGLSKEKVYEITEEVSSLEINFYGGPKEGESYQPKAMKASARAASSMSTTISVVKNQYGYNSSGGHGNYNKYTRFNATGAYNSAAYCAEHSRNLSASYLTGSVISDSTIRKILYYGYRGPKQWSGFASSTYNSSYALWGENTSKTEACGVCVTAQALSDRYKALGGGGIYEDVSGLSAFMSYVNSQSDPGSSWTVYRAKATGQDMMWGVYNPNGYVKVKKTNASNGHLVAECPENYSLEGAKYGVYKTEANAENDVSRVATLTTDKDGNTKSATLSAGTYYVKEVEAPKGYSLDKEAYKVTITSGKTSTVSSKDEPKFDPLSIMLTKKPVEGSDKNLRIEGAEYTIKYYKELFDGEGNRITTEKQLNNLKPYRTWVIRTNDKGVALLRDNYLVKEKSDELFKDDDGRQAGLHGTYSIEETLAPQGFAKTDKVWVQQADFDHKLQQIKTELEDITDNEKPQTISITLNKVDAETGKNKPQGFGSLAGAKYDLFFFDPVKSEDVKVATLTTDEKGFARYEGGKPGLYKMVETKASDGYILDKDYHEVNKEGNLL